MRQADLATPVNGKMKVRKHTILKAKETYSKFILNVFNLLSTDLCPFPSDVCTAQQ